MSFQQGLSGLNAASKSLDVIGNNVANTTTVGYKQSRAEFSDVYAASLSGAGSSNIGLGTQVAAVTQQFTQGNITASNNPMDVAINGRGFFRMSQGGSISYTRNGQFQMDKNNYIVDARGLQLTGFALNTTTGVLDTSTPVPLQLNTGDQTPRVTGGATTNPGVSGQFNLDSRNVTIVTPSMNAAATSINAAVAGVTAAATAPLPPAANAADAAATLALITTAANTAAGLVAATPPDAKTVAMNAALAAISAATTASTAAGANGASTLLAATTSTAVTLAANTPGVGKDFNYQDPTTFNQSTSLAIYDQQGNPYSQTLYFKKTADNIWEVYSTLTSSRTDASGGVTSVTTPLPPPAAQTLAATLTFNANGTLVSTVPAAPTVTVPAGGFVLTGTAFSFPLSFTGTSQFGASFGVNALSQDGYSSGKLTGTSISPDGLIKGRYTNGQTKTLGQVTVTNFQNPQGLQPLGNNQWGETSASGNAVPVAGVPGSGSLGVLQASAVEDSNVDLTAELVNMITAQRVYQANAQTIKTQDSVMQTLVNLR
jgi:flagellar hook protein FlgE